MADLRPVLTSVLRPCLRRAFPGTASGSKPFDADALAWYNAVVAAGSTVNVNNRVAQNTLIKGLKADGVWNLITELYLYAGPSSLAGALVKAKGSGTRTNVNFVSGDFSRTAGLLGNGSTKYLSNGFSAADLNSLSHGIFVYGSGFAAAGDISMSGVFDSAEPTLLSLDVYASYANARTFRSGRFTGGLFPALNTGLITSGSLAGMRTSATAAALYQNGVSVATSATSTTPLFPNLVPYSFGMNSSNVPGGYSADRRAVEAWTDGLSGPENLALHNRVATYVASLT